MTKKHHHPITLGTQEPYLMHIADLLSDDPILIAVLGLRFKVVAYCDRKAKRVTYSFRCVDDTQPDEWEGKPALAP